MISSSVLYASGIPAHMHDVLTNYIVRHRQPGQFLVALLSNDLAGACALADAQNKLALADYVMFLCTYAPASCWGSPAKVKAWLELR